MGKLVKNRKNPSVDMDKFRGGRIFPVKKFRGQRRFLSIALIEMHLKIPQNSEYYSRFCDLFSLFKEIA